MDLQFNNKLDIWYKVQYHPKNNLTIWRKSTYKNLQIEIIYQCTNNNKPPKIDTGYYNLDSLLKLKGIK